MIIAAASDCFPDLSLEDAMERLVDLEYTHVEIALHEQGNQLKPSEVVADPQRTLELCRQTQRLTPVAYSIQIDAAGEEHYRQFAACCRLAKATKVAALVIPGAEQGTPFNEEVEHLRQLVKIATFEGALVAVKTQVGRITQDPATTTVLCDNVKGLGITLDPSCFLYAENAGVSYEQLLKYVYHVHLRDTNKNHFQVRVGQGDVEYGRLVNQLKQAKYNHALSVHIQPQPGVDHGGELRKLRLLLDSLIM